GKKVPDARRGRNWTRAMENCAKPPTIHRRVHGPVHGPRTCGTGTREKSAQRPSWTELDARHGKLGKTTDEAPTRTRTRTRTQNGRYVDTGKKCPMPVVDGTGRAPWKTGQNHRRGTDAYTDPYTDPERVVRGHGKKVPDARRGRNWTRAMENRAKPPTSHRRVHGPVQAPRTGGTWTREKSARCPSWTELDARHGKLRKTTDDPPTRTRTRTRTQNVRYGDTGKKCPTPVVDGTGRAPWKTGQNHRRGTDAYTDPYTDPERVVRGHGKKSARRPSWTELDARHGKLGKTTDEAPTRTRTRTRTRNGRYVDTGKKCPTPVVDETGRAPWKTGQNHR